MSRSVMTFFIMKVLMGTMIAISSNHWFLIWIGLEIKTLSMMPIMSYLQSPRKVEASIKYFLMKTLAAAMMLNCALMNVWTKGTWTITKPMKNIKSIMISGALFFKLSMFPFHSWLPDVMSGVKLLQGLLMTTWQKMAPTMMTLSMMKHLKLNFVMCCTTISTLIGAWGGLKQTQTRKILAYSSISHISWMILTGMFNQQASLMMLMIYIIMKSSVFLSLKMKKTNSIASIKKNSKTMAWATPLMTLTILSLGGLPPLTGFIKKILSLKMLITKNSLLPMMILILSSLMSLFFYLRMAFKSNLTTFPLHSLSMFSSRKNRKTYKIIKSMTLTTSLISMMMLPTLMSLFS